MYPLGATPAPLRRELSDILMRYTPMTSPAVTHGRDQGRPRAMGRILIVSTVEHVEDQLRELVDTDDEIMVVVPAVRQGLLDWLANDEKAFSHAAAVAQETADAVPGTTVDAVAGEADVELAVRDALAEFPADEIVIAVRPDEEEGLVEAAATEDATRRSFDGIPVRYVIASD